MLFPTLSNAEFMEPKRLDKVCCVVLKIDGVFSFLRVVMSKIAAALARHTHALVPPIHITACENIVRLFELAA